MMRRMGIWWRALVDLLLPRTCLVCGRKLGLHEEHICLYCLADMPLTHFWERSHNPMADKINGLIQERLCSKLDSGSSGGPGGPVGSGGPGCSGGPVGCGVREPYAYACTLFYFQSESAYRHILYSLKYKGNTAAGEHFGRMLGRKMSGAEHFKDVDVVIPVPLHWTRKWSRGYNQAEYIAKTLATELGAQIRKDILLRRRRTSTQTKVDVEQKGKNVHGAFEAVVPEHMPAHILIVDDVFTTGSTLSACHEALRKALPASVRISIATLGYVGRA